IFKKLRSTSYTNIIKQPPEMYTNELYNKCGHSKTAKKRKSIMMMRTGKLKVLNKKATIKLRGQKRS
ncbi:MAG TPA: hypothetical protein PKV35_10510, partial [bacterium]|nr:hypothetical protein [bacterium]